MSSAKLSKLTNAEFMPLIADFAKNRVQNWGEPIINGSAP